MFFRVFTVADDNPKIYNNEESKAGLLVIFNWYRLDWREQCLTRDSLCCCKLNILTAERFCREKLTANFIKINLNESEGLSHSGWFQYVLTGVKDFQYIQGLWWIYTYRPYWWRQPCKRGTHPSSCEDRCLVLFLITYSITYRGGAGGKRKKVVGIFEHIFSQWNEHSAHVMSLCCGEHEGELPFTKHVQDEFSSFERPAWGECRQDRNSQPSTLEQS